MRPLALAFLCATLALSPARAAESIVLDNVTIVAGTTIYRAPRITIEDSALTRDEALKLLDATSPGTLETRIAGLSAGRITIPELAAETKSTGITQSVIYRDIIITGIDKGRIATLNASGTKIAAQSAQGGIEGESGAYAASGIDLPALAHIATQARKEDEPRRAIIAEASIDALNLRIGGGQSIKAQRITLKNLSARALAVEPGSLVDLSPKTDAPPLTPERTQAMVVLLTDLLQSFALERLDITGLDIAANTASTSVGTITLDKIDGGLIANITLGNIAQRESNAALFTLGRVAIDGLDLRPVFDRARDNAAALRLSPRFAKLEFSDGNLALADKREGGNATVASGRISTENWTSALPARLYFALDGFSYPAALLEPSLQSLIGAQPLLTLNVALGARYDAANLTFAFDQAALGIAGVGDARAALQFGNVQPDILSGDPDRMQNVLLGANVRSASLDISNAKLVDTLIANEARRTGAAPDAVRAQYAQLADLLVRATLGTHPQADELARAASQFVMKPNMLSVGAEAPDGLSLIELMLAGKSTAWLQRLKFKVSAE